MVEGDKKIKKNAGNGVVKSDAEKEQRKVQRNRL
jgi:hypothetical protein